LIVQTPEQSSKQLQQAQRELHEAQKQHRESLEQLRKLRSAYANTNHGLSDPASEAGKENRRALAELRTKIDAAMQQRDKARTQLTQAKDAAQSAEREACRAVGDKHRPAYHKALAAYVVAKLESIEPMAVATHEALEIREAVRVALGVRREHHARMQPALGLLQDHEKFEQMRQEVRELIEQGVMKPADVPKGLRQAWNI